MVRYSLFVVCCALVVLAVFGVGVYGEIDAQRDKQSRADITKPFFKHFQTMCQAANTDCAITYQPCNQHDRQSGTQSEHNQHQPRYTHRHSHGEVYHRDEINQSVRTKSHRKEYTQQERPQPTRPAIGVLQPFAYPMVMLVVVSADEQHNTAQEHKHRQYRFTVFLYNILNTIGLCTKQERNAQ